MGPAARVQGWVNLESGVRSRLYVSSTPGIAAFPPAPHPQDGERERRKSDVGSSNIFDRFSRNASIRSWDVTFHGQFEAQMYILFQTKGANLFHTILHFIFAWVTGVF